MPMVMANCWSEAREPRHLAGAISAMYAGAITEAMPIPSPPSTRQSMRSGTLNANPEPIEEMTNRAEPSSMTFLRPQRSARLPANQAPTAHPMRAIATTKPVVNEPREK